ncbi:MAG: FAD-dependent oxidoreductase [Chloroflexi bacterium]|nr:FAD-dependent oxidoreductase [Chloroflexota bacterium]MCH8094684.1 FAD-dependent oxidoreductase [Chloroflexota bacterium]MCI0773679.1 FAD-dependent oxidoreductase [Chloroflexota bacterium]MCI0807018.1 FAD-dependent oxidoreductase [Chloroflexota bacterium]MCI0827951.1 FAD-dependent oxidoreductase [Chloroflexota bacterium]
MSDAYDVAVIGAGQGGLPAAHMAANLGAKVLLVEDREVGGT